MFLESFLYFYYFVFFLPVNLLLHIIGNISHPQYFQKCSVLCILSPPIIQYPYNTVLNKAFKSCVTIPSMQFDLNSFLQKSVFASFIVGLYSSENQTLSGPIGHFPLTLGLRAPLGSSPKLAHIR